MFLHLTVVVDATKIDVPKFLIKIVLVVFGYGQDCISGIWL